MKTKEEYDIIYSKIFIFTTGLGKFEIYYYSNLMY